MVRPSESGAAAATEASLKELGIRELSEADGRARYLLPEVFLWTKTRWLLSTALVCWLFWEQGAAIGVALAWLMLVIELQGIFVADVWLAVFRGEGRSAVPRRRGDH